MRLPSIEPIIEFRMRLLVLGGVAVFTLLLARSTFIMGWLGTTLREQADINRTFNRVLSPARGIIFDRKGIPLVVNAPLYEKIEGNVAVISPTLFPIDEHTAFTLLLQSPELLVLSPQRSYPFGPALSAAIGYVSSLTPVQTVGKSGLESLFDSELVGTTGVEMFERDAVGKLTRVSQTILPISGKDIHVSLNAALSQKAYELLNNRKGAVVVSDVPTSQVLALVSSPSFNPSDIVSSLNDPNTPLLNRALLAYPPGSVFKMMTALAALKNGALTKDTLLDDEGEIKVGEAVFRNWYFTSYGRTEGNINVVRALTSSNDVFFYKAAGATGPESIAQMALSFHLGEKTNLGLSQEQAGLIPTPSWKEKTIGEKWYLGDTYHMGIGQGDVLVTPLQLNAMTAALARQGIWCQPTLSLDGEKTCDEIDVSKDDIQTVINGMVGACSSGGTAYPFFTTNEALSEDQKIACKTGTAEHGGADSHGRRSTDAWLTMFYPRVNPKVSITVMLESDSNTQFLEGSADAAPIAKGVFEFWKENE